MEVGIVGLGVMGSAVAGHLLDAGYSVRGFDVADERCEALAGLGGIPQSSARAVAEHSEVVLFWLPSAEAMAGAAEEVAAGAHRGLVVVEMGTLPLDAKESARVALAAAGVELLDAPVSGTGRQAADASLVIFSSGSPEAYRRVRPVFDVIGKASYHFPSFGHGSVMKYIANLLVTVHNLAAAEAHVLGIAAGMDPGTVQRVMSDGVGASRMLDIRGPMMVTGEYEPPAGRLDIILKDARIIKAFAEGLGSPTPLLDAALRVYEAASEGGLGSLDAAAVCRYLEGYLLRSGRRRPG